VAASGDEVTLWSVVAVTSRFGGRIRLLPRLAPMLEGLRYPGAGGHVGWPVGASGPLCRGLPVVPLVTLVSRS
jgi:hypothetical protein